MLSSASDDDRQKASSASEKKDDGWEEPEADSDLAKMVENTVAEWCWNTSGADLLDFGGRAADCPERRGFFGRVRLVSFAQGVISYREMSLVNPVNRTQISYHRNS